MPLYHACDANLPEGEAITPIARKRIQDGKYFVPDCPDYDSKFGLPRRIKIKVVYAGWSCFNCKHLLESTTPFSGPQHTEFKAQPMQMEIGNAPEPERAPAPESGGA